MKTYAFPQRSIPLHDEWDVIVVGGGPSGCTAATSAAREGAKTLLIEVTQALGGSGTSSLVPAWCPFSDHEKIIYRGLAEKVLQKSKEGCAHIAPDRIDWVPIDPEKLKRIYDEMVISSGASVLFQTFLSSVEKKADGGVDSIIVSNKKGLSAYKAKVYVDCTGDGDLSAWAGAEFHKGDENGELQHATHCFILSNVNEAAHAKMPSLHPGNKESLIFDILKSGKYPAIPDYHICENIIGPGTVGFNAGHVHKVDNTDPTSVSRAVIEGRKMAAAYREALADYVPEVFGNAFLVSTGATIGIRETRRIIGDYLLTLDDYMHRRTFPDDICRNAYYIDVHMTLKEEVENSYNSHMNTEKRTLRYKPGESHGIPYRCLTPKGLRNVLVAGRCISAERSVQGSTRVMPVCLAMGEAAGMAAAHALQYHDSNVHKVDTNRLRKRLREEGAYLPEAY